MSNCDVLFVASNLSVVIAQQEKNALSERSIDGLVHRTLDPTYYAWLRSKVEAAAKATDARQMSADSYDRLLGKFDGIHRWATHAFGREALRSAMESLDVNRYRAPSDKSLSDCEASVHRFPDQGSWTCSHPVAPKVIGLVDTIAQEAFALGWTKRGLYQNRSNLKFPYGKDWGLVCFLREGDKIGAISSSAIEIVGPAPGANPLKYYNPDRKVEQAELVAT